MSHLCKNQFLHMSYFFHRSLGVVINSLHIGVSELLYKSFLILLFNYNMNLFSIIGKENIIYF